MKRITLLLATTIACNGMTLEQAPTVAHQHRPLLKAQHQGIVRAQHMQKHAHGAYLPQLSAHHSSSFTQTASTDNSSTHTVSLRGSQLIFSPNGPQVQAEMAAHQTSRAHHTFTASSHQVRHDAATAFLTAWLLQEKHALITALQSWQDATTARAATAYNLAQQSVHDFATTNATAAMHQATITAYPHECATARAHLRTALGTATTSLTYTPTPQPALASLNTYLNAAYKNRPELKANTAAHKQYTLSARSQRLSYLPSFHLNGSVGRTFSGTSVDRGTNASIGVSASWQFFDGMQRSNAARAADADALRTDFERQELRNTITQQVTAAYHAIAASQAQLNAAQVTHTTQAGLFARDTKAYELGSMSPVAYAKRQYEYEQSAHALRSAQINLRKEYETLHWRCGYSERLFDE